MLAMKTNSIIVFALFLSAMTVSISCSNQNNGPGNQSVNNSQLKDGAWKVTYYWDKDHDETSSLASYTIMFNSDGTVNAVNGNDAISGTWSTGTDDSQPKLILSFAVAPLSEISDDWHVINQSSNLLSLEDVSHGNGTTELLTLEKI